MVGAGQVTALRAWLVAAAAASAPALLGASLAGCAREIPPRGEAVLVVDTDLPVPSIVNRLRIDMYTADRSQWYVSREVQALDPRDWPVSFSVYDPDDGSPRDVVVRLRAFQSGIVRDYHGERFSPRPSGGAGSAATPAPIAPVPPGETPRLIADDGADATPPNEPLPSVTVDRLVRVALVPGTRGSVRLVLRGACAGTMADLAQGTSCIDRDRSADAIETAALDPDLTLPSTTLAGTFGATTPCTADVRPSSNAPDGTPLFDDEVCVPGGISILGTADAFGRGDFADVPQRIALVAPFRMDRHEVTVGRYRDAVARGLLAPTQPYVNSGTVDFSDATALRSCTWSVTPLGRESLPVTCVRRATARAFCQFIGGDLPTEAQWEYVATSVGRPAKTRFAWGDEAPSCDRAVWGRHASSALDFHAAACNKLGIGAAPVDMAFGDVALGTGIVGLSGNVTELMRDTFASLASSCWASQPLESPSCVDPKGTLFAIRGGSWLTNEAALSAGFRGGTADADAASETGFRCVREVP